MNFSMSDIITYYRCRRKLAFSGENYMRLRPKKPNLNFDLGTAVHAALAEWAQNPTIDPVQSYGLAMTRLTIEAEEKYRQLVGVGASESERQPLYDNEQLGKAMVRNYVEHWKQPLQEGFELVATEQEFLVAIPNTPHHLQGRVDLIIKDSFGQLYIPDHKTYSTRPSPQLVLTTPQFTGYTWAISQMFENVRGVAYDGLWKREKPPKNLELKDLFMRMLVKPNSSALQEFENSLATITTEIANQPLEDLLDIPHRTTDGSCFWGCGYEQLCSAMTNGEDIQYLADSFYYRSESRYPQQVNE